LASEQGVHRRDARDHGVTIQSLNNPIYVHRPDARDHGAGGVSHFFKSILHKLEGVNDEEVFVDELLKGEERGTNAVLVNKEANDTVIEAEDAIPSKSSSPTATKSVSKSLSATPSVSRSSSPSIYKPRSAPAREVTTLTDSCRLLAYKGEDNINLITFTNFWGSSDSQGRIFVGGDAHLEAFSLGTLIAPGTAVSDSLVVEGGLNFQSGLIHGNIKVCGRCDVDMSLRHSLDGSDIYHECGRIDFEDAYAYYASMSDVLCAMSPTGYSNTDRDSAMVFTSEGNQGFDVFNLDCDLLEETNYFKIHHNTSDVVVINLRPGGSGDPEGYNECLLRGDWALRHGGSKSRVLLNACSGIMTINVKTALTASVLAPDTDVIGLSGVITGQVIANSFLGRTQLNLAEFDMCDEHEDHSSIGGAIADNVADILSGDLDLGDSIYGAVDNLIPDSVSDVLGGLFGGGSDSGSSNRNDDDDGGLFGFMGDVVGNDDDDRNNDDDDDGLFGFVGDALGNDDDDRNNDDDDDDLWGDIVDGILDVNNEGARVDDLPTRFTDVASKSDTEDLANKSNLGKIHQEKLTNEKKRLIETAGKLSETKAKQLLREEIRSKKRQVNAAARKFRKEFNRKMNQKNKERSTLQS